KAGILLIGFGNPGRLDDGLGPALAARIEQLQLPNVTVDSDYQLTVEDAAAAAEHDAVIFADADVSGPEPFYMRRLSPAGGTLSFSTHSITPQAVLTLARELFRTEPQGFLLGIRGYEFNEFGERLSEQATKNLDAAVTYLAKALETGKIEEIRADGVRP
ncbi:MAG: hydrogenase maturation protease, partial [Planctomycetes bacterium]|nr:hydrogenase maturation protease [Planctomycetota bacterium]